MRNDNHTLGRLFTRSPVRAALLALIACAVWATAACNRKDAVKCQEGQNGVRKSLEAADQQLLQKWRNYAYEHCADRAALQTLDQEIAQQQAAAAKKKREAAKLQKQNDQLLQLFLGWAGTHRANPAAAAATVNCGGGEAEEKSQERWCNRTRSTQGTPPSQFNVRYWEKDPQAVSFDVKLPQPITCEKLGAHRIVRSWTVPNQKVKRTHCEITAGPLGGMQAMISEALNAPLHIISPKFLEMNPALKNKLDNEGR
jgi:hypothetical protein